MSSVVQYLSLNYEDYKALEEQMRDFGETTHKSTEGFYHKSIRLQLGSGLIMEFHGPLVKAAEIVEGTAAHNPYYQQLKAVLRSLADGEVTARDVAIKAREFVSSLEKTKDSDKSQ